MALELCDFSVDPDQYLETLNFCDFREGGGGVRSPCPPLDPPMVIYTLCFQRKQVPATFVKFDLEAQSPVRNKFGRCIPAAAGTHLCHDM